MTKVVLHIESTMRCPNRNFGAEVTPTNYTTNGVYLQQQRLITFTVGMNHTIASNKVEAEIKLAV